MLRFFNQSAYETRVNWQLRTKLVNCLYIKLIRASQRMFPWAIDVGYRMIP